MVIIFIHQIMDPNPVAFHFIYPVLMTNCLTLRWKVMESSNLIK